MKDLITKHAIINALEHDGKADANAVLGKILAEDSSLKSQIKQILPEIKKVVAEINSSAPIRVGARPRQVKLGLVVRAAMVDHQGIAIFVNDLGIAEPLLECGGLSDIAAPSRCEFPASFISLLMSWMFRLVPLRQLFQRCRMQRLVACEYDTRLL